MINLNKHKIDGNCPSCNRVFTITLGQVSNQETITCKSCNEEINLIDNNGTTKKGLKDINKAFTDLDKSFKNLKNLKL